VPALNKTGSGDAFGLRRSMNIERRLGGNCHWRPALYWVGVRLPRSTSTAVSPQGNGVADSFIRTLKEQCFWVRLYDDVDDLHQNCRHLHRDLQQRVAHQTPRAPSTTRGAHRADGDGGGMISPHARKQTRSGQSICPTNRGRNTSVIHFSTPTPVGRPQAGSGMRTLRMARGASQRPTTSTR
jgi:hypothetical protein